MLFCFDTFVSAVKLQLTVLAKLINRLRPAKQEKKLSVYSIKVQFFFKQRNVVNNYNEMERYICLHFWLLTFVLLKIIDVNVHQRIDIKTELKARQNMS